MKKEFWHYMEEVNNNLQVQNESIEQTLGYVMAALIPFTSGATLALWNNIHKSNKWDEIKKNGTPEQKELITKIVKAANELGYSGKSKSFALPHVTDIREKTKDKLSRPKTENKEEIEKNLKIIDDSLKKLFPSFPTIITNKIKAFFSKSSESK